MCQVEAPPQADVLRDGEDGAVDDRPRPLPCSGNLPPMTVDEPFTRALELYTERPMPSGSVALLLRERASIEVPGLADEWDEQLCTNVAAVLRQYGSTVLVAVARPGGELLPHDFAMWRDLHAALRDSPVELRPLRALPASDDTVAQAS